ncbi:MULTISPECIES: hypothetical protein [Burkholderia]|uniref:hypothetical protein n=1 Tax=Burkholderia TaxID=32008 RepID=UPI001FC7F462|nr:hypothetical protein [Burkholderia ambifaria]
MQMINASEKTICGHAPLRWNAGFEPGGADSPIALVVVCMAMQVEPVEGLARSICRAWPGQRARAEIWTQIDSMLAVRKPTHRDGVTGFDAHRYPCIHYV